MKISASIELVMQLAGQEAMAGRFGEIEPEHILAGILKFSELPINDIGKLIPVAGVAKQLSMEIYAVQHELASRALDSTQIRRKLRTQMGRGTSPYEGKAIHRSQASRKVFDVAAKLAEDSRSSALTPRELLETLLIAPTKNIEKVLGDAVGPRASRKPKTPLLDKQGKNLAAADTNATLLKVTNRSVECKALVRALTQGDCQSILLISDSDRTVREVVTELSNETSKKDAPLDFRDRQIKDLTGIQLDSHSEPQTIEQQDQLFAEAADARSVILFLPPITIDAGQTSTKVSEQVDLLKKSLQKYSVQCIFRVTPLAYHEWIQKDLEWKRLAQVMWIHDEVTGDIPREL